MMNDSPSFDSKIQYAKNEIKETKARILQDLDAILKKIEPHTKVEFKLKTLRSDVSTFEKSISHLQDLLSFAERVSDSNEMTLKDVRDYLQRLRKSIQEEKSDDKNIQWYIKYVGLQDSIDALESISKSKEESLEKVKKLLSKVKHVSVKATIDRGIPTIDRLGSTEYFGKTIYENPFEVSVSLCKICSDMFQKASSAAYEVIHAHDEYSDE